MSQVTIYLDPETESKVRKIVKKKGISKSRWIADLIREKTDSIWPEEIRNLAGEWTDLPSAEEIRRPSRAKDAKREGI
jgi:hypothetical protein